MGFLAPLSLEAQRFLVPLEVRLFLAPLLLEAQRFLVPLEVRLFLAPLSLEAQRFLAPLEVQLVLAQLPLEAQPSLEAQRFLAPLSLEVQQFLAPLEVRLFLAQLSLEAQRFLAPLEVQLFLDQLSLEAQPPLEAQRFLDPLSLEAQRFLAPLEVRLFLAQLWLQQQVLEVLVVTMTHGLRRATSATKSFPKSCWTTLLRRLHVKLLEPTPTWQLQKLRQSRMSSTICGQPSEMRKPTPGSVSTIVALKQVLATTLLMELSLSQMDQVLLSRLVLSRTKMLNGKVMTISRTASLLPSLTRDKSRTVSKLIKL